MAKKGMVARERKREKLVAKYAEKRAALLEEFENAEGPGAKFAVHRKIQQLPRASSRTPQSLLENGTAARLLS